MSELEITLIPALKDNYIALLRDSESGQTAAVDPSEALPVVKALSERGWKLDYILNTHHHWDHTDGNFDLIREYQAKVVGSANDAHRIPGIGIEVKEGEHFTLGRHAASVMEISGHTIGHIAFHFEAQKCIFVGDTLFSIGCGRLFEGTPEQMWESLSRLRNLPPETKIYCGHEYTDSNIDFALVVEPNNQALLEYQKKVKALRTQGLPTLPTTVETECAANPFLRPESPEIHKHFNLTNPTLVEAFTEVRKLRNTW